ncbi:cell division protein FtsA, partial [Jeotgalibaca porci]|uniref:cell division protein FtsA n=1 Tax=Jeotgalibaca porci TaxID=1868793 RepID=UPI00359F4469
MKKQGSFVSLDIGTTSIKVVVAEYYNNQLNVIGVGNEVSKGLNRGVIVDIDETVASIKKAVEQAEKKSGTKIQQVVVGIPGNQISIEPCHGMYAVASENKEITDRDVQNVFEAARVRSLPPEREIISVIPEEFIVDGFDGIRDPRGMIGVRLELYASMITGPKTIIHNIKRCVERAGLIIQDMVVQPLAVSSI